MSQKIRVAPKYPPIRMPEGAGRTPPLVAAYERFLAEVEWAQDNHGKALCKVLEPAVRKARNKAAALLRRAVDTRSAFELPKEATPQQLKQDLYDECYHYSRQVAFIHGGADPWTSTGPCFTCSHVGTVYWGHFISQADSRLLRYHEHNTRPQCGTCNDPARGGGRYREFRANLEKEAAGRAAKVELLHAEKGRNDWRVKDLEKERDRIREYLRRLGAERGVYVSLDYEPPKMRK